VSYTLQDQEGLLSQAIEGQASQVLPMLGQAYSIQNFNLSKKVSFLLEKNSTRLKPLEILDAFDELKNIFSPTDKGEIQCYDISIVEDSLSITCDAFSSDWNTDIVTINDGSIEILP
jgi:hypothetical protein